MSLAHKKKYCYSVNHVTELFVSMGPEMQKSEVPNFLVLYRKTINNLGIKLEEYWQEIRHRRKTEDPNSIPVEDTMLVHFAVTDTMYSTGVFV